MDAQTSNNLSQALNVAAGGMMQYAQMQREDRMAQAQQQFKMMLLQHQDAQHAADKQQESTQFDETRTDKGKQAAAELTNEEANRTQQQQFHGDTMGIEKQRLAIEASKATGDKTDAVNQKILSVYQQRAQHASALHLSAVNEMESKLKPNPMGLPEIDQQNDAIKRQYQPIIQKYGAQADDAYAQYSTLQSKLAGVPATPASSAAATAPTAPAATAPAATSGAPGKPQVRYDSKGNAFIQGPDGKAMPYNPTGDTTDDTSGDGTMSADQPSVAQAAPDQTPLGQAPTLDPSTTG